MLYQNLSERFRMLSILLVLVYMANVDRTNSAAFINV